MNGKRLVKVLTFSLALLALVACGVEQPVDVKAITSQPKTYVGSDTCKMCHLEHYDSWKMTQHSRMIQDAQKNRDVIVVPIEEEKIRADLAKLEKKLKVPSKDIYVPTVDEILYTIGSQWKQRYIVKKDGTLFISPIQYNLETHRWVNYHEADWDKRPWLLKCGGCHTTGVDLEKQTFNETGVACEACHGKGSWHAALPKTEVFEKRQTIVNPAKLPSGVAQQICGSCHNRGKATQMKGAGWPVGYEPGKSLSAFYVSTSYAGGDKRHLYSNEFSKGHHQQHIDWSQSPHSKEGVTCTSCHYVHQIGIPPTRSQTRAAGSKQCSECHTLTNKVGAHSIHSFGNCVGCHMPRIAKSAEIGDIRSHTFIALLPIETIKDPTIPNSCTSCHRHKDADLQKLQQTYEILAQHPKPVGKTITTVPYK
ncbi:MAG: multiheme c-type cytochrome [Deltaproteobacteria bacterium]|nr:multiheme c-type cytochrome [Deltaproteobacteria bacterium]MDH3802227.1 multiheme c-type cytochrome [Deltaproteobacteria bacterium]MDH3851843.1 multiheme c-type cytochrome [Deltaproteobacteria bacterium]MDH3929374.1 multiheme c-type cytochrome [Deltaproteobacteria bacterium]MDH3964336.1 multiheme c-type cytochrome [Deltaproteobacteria bacterium]